MAHESKSPSQHMFVLTYTPRADAAARGYDQWLRDVDNPFFNAQPGIVHYENWKVRQTLLGDVGWTYFDFMYVDGPDGVLKVWGNPAVAEFAAEWSRLWGVDPDAGEDQSRNYHIFRCEEIAGPIVPQRTEYCIFLPYAPRDDVHARGYDEYLRETDNVFFNSDAVPELISDANWRAVEDVVGHEEWTDFDMTLVEGPDGWERFSANPTAMEFAGQWVKDWGRNPDGGPEVNIDGVLGELVASPNKR